MNRRTSGDRFSKTKRQALRGFVDERSGFDPVSDLVTYAVVLESMRSGVPRPAGAAEWNGGFPRIPPVTPVTVVAVQLG